MSTNVSRVKRYGIYNTKTHTLRQSPRFSTRAKARTWRRTHASIPTRIFDRETGTFTR